MHTEAVIDLMRIAGLRPCGVLCEILDETGDRANTERLMAIAEEHNLQIITIEDLIKYRRQRERIVDRVSEANLPTRYGPARIYAYKIKYEEGDPVAVVYGDPTKVDAPLVRLHSSCFTGDLIASLRCDCGDQLHKSLTMIRNEGAGVLVYLPQ